MDSKTSKLFMVARVVVIIIALIGAILAGMERKWAEAGWALATAITTADYIALRRKYP